MIYENNKKNIIPFVSYPMYYFGCERFLRKFSKAKNLIITYHGITKLNYNHINKRHTTVENLKLQINYFKKHFRIVSLKEIFSLYRRNSNHSKSTIAITFDDGYENNFTNALPLIEKFEIPVTFFISSICLDKGNSILWPDLIDIFIHFSDTNRLEFEDLIFNKYNNTFYTSNNVELRNFIKSLNLEERDRFLKIIMKYLPYKKINSYIPSEFYKLLNYEQLKIISQNQNIEIGSHSHQHLNLANISFKESKNELITSKKLLESIINNNVESFASTDGSSNENIKNLA